jgi:phosphonate transport system substrate-binding protein
VHEIRERLENHSTELLILTTTDYLELESTHLAVPVLVNTLASQAGSAYSYLLLVNPSSTATTVEDLRGKNVVTSSRSRWNVSGMWLEVLLAKGNLGRASSFFSSFKTTEKSQECVLPLFFGKVDACVVGEPDLNLAKEMNPQLGRLRVLARSRPMVEGVLATPVEPTPGRKELIDAILGLNLDPRGRQVLQLFRTERVVRIQPGDLDSARELFADYRRLQATSPISPRNPGAVEKSPAALQAEGRAAK